MSRTPTSRITVLLATTKLEESRNDETNAISVTGESDADLLARISREDRDSLAELFCRYARYVRGIAYRVLRDAGEADDLVQDVFLLINQIAGRFDSSKGAARFWIAQVAYRRAIMRRRRLVTRRHYTQIELDGGILDVLASRTSIQYYDNSLEGSFGKKAVEDVFDSLSENQRQTLRLFFFEGLTLDEIALEMGQSRENVQHHLFSRAGQIATVSERQAPRSLRNYEQVQFRQNTQPTT